MSEDEEEFERIVKKVEDKLDANPELRTKLQEHVEAIEDIFGYPIEVNIVYLKGLEEYREVFETYEEDELEIDTTMSLGEFMEFIENEEQNLDVAIDPIHLKKGINPIKNVLVTTYDNKAIIVPITDKNDE